MNKSLAIVLSGEAGQGLQTIEEFLVKTLSKKYFIFSIKDVMSRVRGGNNTVELRISDQPVNAYQEQIDLLFLLNDSHFDRIKNRLKPNTMIFLDESNPILETLQQQHLNLYPIPLDAMAKASGSILFRNTLLFGFIDGLAHNDPQIALPLIEEKYAKRDLSIQTNNKNAYMAGYALSEKYPITHLPPTRLDFPLFISDGTDAIGLGALAGGCNFIAAYPMSPGTGVLTYLASHSNAMEVLVEQAEDEIAAINMTIGAWYAGARGLTTTSGGGFTLMTEGISLSGITETPVVVHVGQRPGPGTGLPTRTEQSDLNLVVYAGHGEFPRIVYAPGNIKDAILLSQKAFYMADKYQIPVFILSDQFLLESLAVEQPFELDPKYMEPFIVPTTPSYKRYALSTSGISPRGIPYHGSGFVKCDSDEHTEDGQITEDFDVRIQMNDKRLSKQKLIIDAYEPAELYGSSSFKKLIIGWGSTYGVLREYVETNPNPDIAFLYIKQPFPLHPSLATYLNQSSTTVVVENNATGQFSNLLQIAFGIKVDVQLLKYNGLAFSIEEIERKMKEIAL